MLAVYELISNFCVGFSNPPDNFECKALDQISNPEFPRIVLSWKQPTLNTKDTDSINYIVTSNYGNEIFTNTTTYEMLLTSDYQPFQLSVSVKREQGDPLDWDGTPATCSITETTERRTSKKINSIPE